jgi:DNA-binding NtrC family response regulator
VARQLLLNKAVMKMNDKKTLLILDDEPSITFSLARCLQSETVSVISCNDSNSAMLALKHRGVDAVIADMKISVSNSHECIDFIHYVRARSNKLPVIMMSGTEDLKVEALEEGADYFFPKPVDLDELIDLLHHLGLEVGHKQV